MMSQAFAVIGGDYRIVMMANELSFQGNLVKAYGFGPEVEFAGSVRRAATLTEALDEVNYVILPLPCSMDGSHVNTALSTDQITLNDLFSKLRPEQTVFAGKADANLKALAEKYGIACHDYFEREEMSVKNAIPTAEGAIDIALRELPITLHSSKCLVLGFGRVAKALSHMLKGLDVNLTVAARKFSDIAWIDAYGYHSLALQELPCQLNSFDVIFNTIPARILDAELLSHVKPDGLIIDLASKPGGVDLTAAGQAGLNVIWALSLPGKVAPKTAGNIMKDTILNIIHETETNA